MTEHPEVVPTNIAQLLQIGLINPRLVERVDEFMGFEWNGRSLGGWWGGGEEESAEEGEGSFVRVGEGYCGDVGGGSGWG